MLVGGAFVENPERFLSLTATGWAAIASIANAISLLILAGFNVRYLHAANIQAKAASEQSSVANKALKVAEDSNRIARDTLQQQKRPWVGLDDGANAVVVGPVNIDKDGAANAQYAIRVKNFGDAPAQGVLVTATLMITEDLADIQTEQETLFRPNQDQSIGLVLFPNQIGGWNSASYFPSARMKSMTYDHLFEAWLVGTVRYRDGFGNNYQTGFRYWMVEPSTMRPFRFTPVSNSKLEKPFLQQGGGGSIR
jgi:hypothetical protein